MALESNLPISVNHLSPDLSFGKVVTGLELEHLEDNSIRKFLLHFWIQDGLILFRNDGIDEKFHLELSRVFGELEPHPVTVGHPESNPELTTIRSSRTILEIDGVRGAGFLGWHSDLTYVERINRGGILRALKPPSCGGLTGFIDQIDAYDTLSATTKARIESLSVVYQIAPYDKLRYGIRGRLKLVSISEDVEKVWRRAETDLPPVVHPMVFVQPETGRKVLNISPFFAAYIEGMNNEEGHALLKALCDHLCDRPAYHHKWSTSELILWDNWRMLHSVTSAPSDEERIMQRTTIKGDYGLGRRLAP